MSVLSVTGLDKEHITKRRKNSTITPIRPNQGSKQGIHHEM